MCENNKNTVPLDISSFLMPKGNTDTDMQYCIPSPSLVPPVILSRSQIQKSLNKGRSVVRKLSCG